MTIIEDNKQCLRTLEDISLELSDDNFDVTFCIANIGFPFWFEIESLYPDIKYLPSLYIDKEESKNKMNEGIKVQIRKKEFYYRNIKHPLLSMISYMESEGYSFDIMTNDTDYRGSCTNRKISVELKNEELYCKNKFTSRGPVKIDYLIDTVEIIFKK